MYKIINTTKNYINALIKIIIFGGYYMKHMKKRGIKFIILFMLMIIYIALIIWKHQLVMLNNERFEDVYLYFVRLIIPIVCFLIGVMYFMTIKNKVTKRYRNKFLFAVLLFILILEILMIDAYFKPVIAYNPLNNIMPMLNLYLRDFLFNHNYLDGFNIILGYFVAKFF